MVKTGKTYEELILESREVYAKIASRREFLFHIGIETLKFHADGHLYPGVYQITWSEFVISFGTTQRRLELVSGLGSIAEILYRCGSRQMFVGGSLITSKSKPNDFDGCYSLAGLNEKRLFQIEPHLLLPEADSVMRLRRKFGGVVEPNRTLPHLGASMFEILQYDARRKVRKGIVSIDLAEFSQD